MDSLVLSRVFLFIQLKVLEHRVQTPWQAHAALELLRA